MDMGVTSRCTDFWTIVEREVKTVIPSHLKNYLEWVNVYLTWMKSSVWSDAVEIVFELTSNWNDVNDV